MPRIFDNIDLKLLPSLCQTLQVSDRSDFCVGYFNLRGWRALDCYIDRWSGGDGHCCRLLVGMQRLPEDQLRVALQLAEAEDEIDNQTALRMKKALAEQFRNQLMIGYGINGRNTRGTWSTTTARGCAQRLTASTEGTQLPL